MGPEGATLDPDQLAAVERAQKRVDELNRQRQRRRDELVALEEEYVRARTKLDAISGSDRTVPAYQRTPTPLPRDLVESLEETMRRARTAREGQ